MSTIKMVFFNRPLGAYAAAGLALALAAAPAVTLAATRSAAPPARAASPAPAPSIQAAPGTRPGFGVSPSYQQITLDAANPSVSYDLQLTNTTPFDQQFDLTTADFGALDETGGVAFQGAAGTTGTTTPGAGATSQSDAQSQQERRYGLASWMKLGANTVLVRAGGSAQVTVSIDNRDSLAPGGHYAAVLATAIADPGPAATKDPRVGLKTVLSSLVLLTKTGGAAPSLKLVSQSISGGTAGLASLAGTAAGATATTANLRFQNDGNLHVVPRGIVKLIDPAGTPVAQGAINDGSAVVLPQSFRRLETPLMALATAWLPGRYTMQTTYRFDGTEATQTLTTHVWYAGQLAGWGVVVGGLGLIGLIAWLVWYGRRRGWRAGRFIGSKRMAAGLTARLRGRRATS